MPIEPIRHRRNLFEVDNARNLSMNELVETFIPTQSFWRLLSAKHNVLLGARGQGKTAVAKMLSHDHFVLFANTRDEPRARSAVENQEFVGIYIPTRLEWVGGLKNKPWLNEREREEFFQWRLNVASCIAFVPIARSCISAYVTGPGQRAKLERELVSHLKRDWIVETSESFDNLSQLRRHLEDVDYRKLVQILKARTMGTHSMDEPQVGMAFGLDLLLPLRQGIRHVSRLLSMNKDCTWLLCLDEAEFLEEMDHRIINSHMRAFPDNLFFKITTMPYCHYTLATNIGAPLVPGQDFGYVNMESDRVLTARTRGDPDTIGTLFGRTLFKRFLDASDPQVVADHDRRILGATEVLGESKLLDPWKEDWSPGSENMQLLERYASRETVDRAKRLLGTPAFMPAIGRKIHGPLLLRKQVDELKGNKAMTVYSGARMAIRCADDNPRHMIRIFNALLQLQSKEQKRFLRVGRTSWISPENQTQAMRTLAASTLTQSQHYPDVGPELHKFLCMLGEFMKADLHDAPLTTDQVTSVAIENTVADRDWRLICVAVGHGLLHPNVGTGQPDEMPWREGTFHLAYSLAPHFLLLPRRGKAASLTSIRRFSRMNQRERQSYLGEVDRQMRLFEDGGE